MSIVALDSLREFVSSADFEGDNSVLQTILTASEDRVEKYLRLDLAEAFSDGLPVPVEQGIIMLAAILYDASDTIVGNRLPFSVRMMVDPFRVMS